MRTLSGVLDMSINGYDDEKNIEFLEFVNDNSFLGEKQNDKVNDIYYGDKKDKVKFINRLIKATKQLPDNLQEEKNIKSKIHINLNKIKNREKNKNY